MQKVHGLVVCGGRSTRMGHDKSLIAYHGIPQWEHMANLMSSLCQKILISCNEAQIKQFTPAYPLLVDDPKYANCGPMAALLTAFRAYPSSPFLVVACDYPSLTRDDLKYLMDEREEATDAVCLYHEIAQIEEPLVAIYEPSIQPVLLNHFKNSEFSLRKVLLKSKTERIRPVSPASLATADTPAESVQLLKSIQSTRS